MPMIQLIYAHARSNSTTDPRRNPDGYAKRNDRDGITGALVCRSDLSICSCSRTARKVDTSYQQNPEGSSSPGGQTALPPQRYRETVSGLGDAQRSRAIVDVEPGGGGCRRNQWRDGG